jgi:hypothetical protein
MKTLCKLPIAIFSLLIIAILLTSFTALKEKYNYSESLELNTLKKLDAEIKFNAGQLNLAGHIKSVMDFKSSYTKSQWKANIKLNKQSGKLSILQPEEENNNMKDEDENIWNIKLPTNVPTNLKLTIGAGEGIVDLKNANLGKMELEAGAGKFDVNLASSTLSELKVNAGVGALTLDLSGTRKNDLNAEINGGIGEIKLTLPKQAGVRINVNGLGDFKREGFKKQGGYYINDAYGKAAKKVNIEVNGGLGSIDLILK